MRRDQNISINRNWKKLIPTLTDDSEGFKPSAEGVAAGVPDMAWELELEVEPEDVTALLPSHDKPVRDGEFLLTVVQGK